MARGRRERKEKKKKENDFIAFCNFQLIFLVFGIGKTTGFSIKCEKNIFGFGASRRAIPYICFLKMSSFLY